MNQTPEVSKEIAVLWPCAQDSNVEEIDFSYSYCKRATQSFLQSYRALEWYDYSVSDLQHQFAKIREANFLLLVTDPSVVITDSCLNRLLESCRSTGRAAVPKYNFSDQQNQQAKLGFEYDTVSTFLELSACSDFDSAASGPTYINQPDNGCIFLPVKLLESLAPNRSEDIFHAIQSEIVLAEKALVHRFVHYADMPRPELVELVPESVNSVLDIGCGTGQYGRSLSQLRPDISIIGVERSAHLASHAASYYSEIMNCNFEEIEPELKVDLINCGDILEHLQDPWGTLEKLFNILNDDGYLVVSIPNASHWSIVRELVRGKFDYLPAGQFCVGHIRWFTEQSFSAILDQSGFTTEKIIRLQPKPSPEGEQLINGLKNISGYNEAALRTHTLLFRAVKKHSKT